MEKEQISKSGSAAASVQPSTDSDLKEERIAARRKRVKNKIEAEKRAALGEEPEQETEEVIDPEKERKSYKQTETSRVRLEKLGTDGKQLVTNVAIAADSKEVTRRQEEVEARKAMYERLEAEVTAGAERFDEIMKKWSEGKDKKIPQEIQELLQQQRAACSAMTDEKDKLINEFQQELKAKDDQYVKHLKKQAEDVDLVLERMEEQAKTLMKAYHEELTQIETSFASERRELVDTQREEWETKMKARGTKEKEFLEAREKRIERNEADVQHLRVRNAEEFNRIKIKLENDIQILQQQIQQMKATFQLNAEKLEYNFQVLKKRDEENTVTMSQQKRRITRLQDTLNTLKGKLSKQEKSCQDELQGLMDEYRKNTEQYRELQKKVKHFQTMDTKRFYDIWMMNEERVCSLAKEVANADETIYYQQLGLEWEAPAIIESPMSKVTASRLERDVSRATLYASQILSDAGDEKTSALELPPPTAGSTTTSLAPTSPALIKQVLNLLCDESGFLIESKLTRLLAPIEKDEQMLMKLDSIFKAIGIETEEDVHQLVKYFIYESSEEEQDSSSAEKPLSLIHPNEVVISVRRFVEARQGPSKAASLTPQTMAVTNKDKQDEVLDGSFWKRMAQVLPENNERVWTALFEGLEKYHETLMSRRSLIAETDNLRQQNMELRLLLHQYMHARINQELEIPPSLVVPVPTVRSVV